MANLSNVDTSDMGGNVVVPAGKYIIQAVKAKDDTSKAGNEMVVVDFEIMDGDYEGVTIKHYFTFASEFPQKWAKKFADCAGVDASNFCADTVVQGSPVKVDIEVEEGTEYIDKDGETQMGYDSNKINPFSFESAI